MWILAAVAEGVLFATIAVLSRRRFDVRGLAVATVVSASGFALIALTPIFAFFGEVRRLPVAGGVIGTVAAAGVLHMFISKHPDPDLVPEVALGTFAFLGGFAVGLVLAGTTVLVIA